MKVLGFGRYHKKEKNIHFENCAFVQGSTISTAEFLTVVMGVLAKDWEKCGGEPA